MIDANIHCLIVVCTMPSLASIPTHHNIHPAKSTYMPCCPITTAKIFCAKSTRGDSCANMRAKKYNTPIVMRIIPICFLESVIDVRAGAFLDFLFFAKTNLFTE